MNPLSTLSHHLVPFSENTIPNCLLGKASPFVGNRMLTPTVALCAETMSFTPPFSDCAHCESFQCRGKISYVGVEARGHSLPPTRESYVGPTTRLSLLHLDLTRKPGGVHRDAKQATRRGERYRGDVRVHFGSETRMATPFGPAHSLYPTGVLLKRTTQQRYSGGWVSP